MKRQRLKESLRCEWCDAPIKRKRYCNDFIVCEDCMLGYYE